MTHTHGFNIATHGTFWNSGLRGYIEKYVGTGRYYLITISEEEAIYLFDTWIKVREPNIEPKARFPWDDRERNVVLPMIVRLCIGLILTEYS